MGNTSVFDTDIIGSSPVTSANPIQVMVGVLTFIYYVKFIAGFSDLSSRYSRVFL